LVTIKRPTIAITGVSGLLGGALAERLLTDGHSVRALFRKVEKGWRNTLRATQIVGSLSDGASLSRLVSGADTVFHVAAMYRHDGPWEEFEEVNLRGTERLLEAAARAGVRRFIYCSTIGVYGNVASSPSNEQAPFAPRDDYQRSKLLAEEACRAARTGDMEIVILRPCGIYGPGDLRMLKLFRMLNRRIFVQIGRGDANFHPVYIDDLVDAFILAMTVPEIDGESFIIGGPEFMPLRDYVKAAAAALPAPAPFLHVPYGLMSVVATMCEWAYAPTKIEPPLHRRRLTFFKHNRAFSIEHARQRLGYAPRVCLEDGFGRTVRWYRQEKLLS
jgi:dihydroflavonol-4-reductase